MSLVTHLGPTVLKTVGGLGLLLVGGRLVLRRIFEVRGGGGRGGGCEGAGAVAGEQRGKADVPCLPPPSPPSGGGSEPQHRGIPCTVPAHRCRRILHHQQV